MHGWGRSTVSSISESPAVFAGNRSVSTFAVVAVVPPASLLRQLTMALKLGTGFVPARPAAITCGSLGSRTRPWTSTSIRPSTRSFPFAWSTTQGSPPPGTPRIAFVGPVYGRGTPTIVLKSRIFLDPWPDATEAGPATSSPPTRTTDDSNNRTLFFMSSPLGCGFIDMRHRHADEVPMKTPLRLATTSVDVEAEQP